MILLIGKNGYVSREFQRFFTEKEIPYYAIEKSAVDYTSKDRLHGFIKANYQNIRHVINCYGYTGRPNVDACEKDKTNCLFANAVFPGILGEVLENFRLPWTHISSGCVYHGRTSLQPFQPNYEGFGFKELAIPNFTFRSDPKVSWYSGTKALGEEVISKFDNCFVLRLRMPFTHKSSDRNLITKLLKYDKLINTVESMTRLEDFIRVSWELIDSGCEKGIYNVVNTGYISHKEICDMASKHLKEYANKKWEFHSLDDFYANGWMNAKRSNCTLDNKKLLATGIQIDDVLTAMEKCFKAWEE